MDRRQSKKRIASSSRSSSPPKQKRRVESSLNSSRSSDELDHDSGLFISDYSDSFNLSEFSPEDHHPFTRTLRTEEKLRVDSPIIKHMEKMSVRPTNTKSPKKQTLNVLQISKGKKSDNFVVGQSIIKIDSHDNNICDNHKPEAREARSSDFRIRHCYISEESDKSADNHSQDKENWPGYQRSPQIFEQHLEIEEDMRSILIAWMMEVCKAYCLRRRTFHMALDYVDRFLTLTENLGKNLLQLVGVAALSLAAKIEEIFPPELKEMAYVTADAHTISEIKSMEKLFFAVLGTAFMPITPSDCVGFFLYKAGLTGSNEKMPMSSFENTRISRENRLPFLLYARICRVLDLALLDAQSLGFSYRQMAAAAIYLVDKTIPASKGLKDISEFNPNNQKYRVCIYWMQRYAKAEPKLPPITDSNPCEDPRHQHHRFLWPHLQLFNFTLEDFMVIMDAKRAEAVLTGASHRNMENNEENALVDDMVDDRDMVDMVERLFDDAKEEKISNNQLSSPSRSGNSEASSQNHLGSMFDTPPDSRNGSRRESSLSAENESMTC